MEFGHHQTQRPDDVGVVSRVGDPRCVRSLVGRLDGRATRIGAARGAAYRRLLHTRRHLTQATNPACGSRVVNCVATRGTPVRRRRRHHLAFTTLRLERQTVLGSAVQDAQASPKFSHAFRFAQRRTRAQRRSLARVQYLASPQRARAAHTLSTCITRRPTRTTPHALTSSPRPTTRVFNALSMVCPPCALQTAAWFNPPKPRPSADVAQEIPPTQCLKLIKSCR